MRIASARFGPLDIDPEEVILFPEGIAGFEECRRWIFLADAENDAVAWMQCIDRPQLALAVVSPRRFVAGYQARVARRELAPLELETPHEAHVLVVMSTADGVVTLNLKAPVVINLRRRLGRQVVANGPLPIRFELAGGVATLKKTA